MKNTDTEIMAGLKEILALIKPSFNADTITKETRLIEDIGLDSLTMMLMSLAIENKFAFHFSGQIQFTTVGEVISFMQNNQE